MFKNLFRKKEIVLRPEEQIAEWEKKGKPLPPVHAVKQKAIREYAEKFNISILVETGTFLGDMIEAQRLHFQSVYSIELSEKLYKRAKKRFKNAANVKLLQGDSGKKIAGIVNELSQPAIFWLDGHYSGGITALGDTQCPVREELNAILSDNKPHIILIDDARLFNGTDDYPTIEEVNNILQKKERKYSLDITDDIIRIVLS